MRNLLNAAFWFALFAAPGFAWTGNLGVAAVTGATGVLLLAILSPRTSTPADVD